VLSSGCSVAARWLLVGCSMWQQVVVWAPAAQPSPSSNNALVRWKRTPEQQKEARRAQWRLYNHTKRRRATQGGGDQAVVATVAAELAAPAGFGRQLFPLAEEQMAEAEEQTAEEPDAPVEEEGAVEGDVSASVSPAILVSCVRSLRSPLAFRLQVWLAFLPHLRLVDEATTPLTEASAAAPSAGAPAPTVAERVFALQDVLAHIALFVLGRANSSSFRPSDVHALAQVSQSAWPAAAEVERRSIARAAEKTAFAHWRRVHKLGRALRAALKKRQALVGRRVRVWWGADDRYYSGTIRRVTVKQFRVELDEAAGMWPSVLHWMRGSELEFI